MPLIRNPSVNVLNRRTGTSVVISATGSTPVSANLGTGGLVKVGVTATGGTITTAFSLDTSIYTPALGDIFELLIRIATGVPGPITWTWPGNFVFSGDDGDVPIANTSGSDAIVRYEFMFAQPGASAGWYAKRWDY